MFWGIDGDSLVPTDFSYDTTHNQVAVLSSKHMVVQNKDQTTYTETDNIPGPFEAGDVKACQTSIYIPAGIDARIVLNGISILTQQGSYLSPIDVAPEASLHLILADATRNVVHTNHYGYAAIRCTTKGKLTIDDSVPNSGINPVNGKVGRDGLLDDGKTKVKKGDSLSVLASSTPGMLRATSTIGSSGILDGACIGGNRDEAGGAITIDGGRILALKQTASDRGGSAGIGGGAHGDGTAIDECIIINGGYIEARGAHHAAGIGGGVRNGSVGTHCGNIEINGGYVKSTGGACSGGFGDGCTTYKSEGYHIVLSGGTLIPTGGSQDMGGWDATVIVTGGSIGNGKDVSQFKFTGNGDNNARNNEGEIVRMVQVDLTSDVGESAYAISKWQLYVDGVPYDYGAPAEFDKGHLYLWLPERIIRNSELTVDLTYLDTDNLDEIGNPTPVTPLPLFRPSDNSLPPGSINDGKLRRYVDFPLDNDYIALLTKDYDGLPLPPLALPIPTPDGRNLTVEGAITYRYQMLDASNNPIGAEMESQDPDGTSRMPADAGSMRFTAISTQYSADTEGHFSESYWGHRAQGRCEIRKVPSAVTAVVATWADGSNMADPQLPQKILNVEVDITSGIFEDGTLTATTCKAPEGRVQLYVDGEPAGDPVSIDFEANGNARVTADADGREHTVVSWSFPAGNLMAAGARHQVTARYLPAKNYFESADPAKTSVPGSEVAVRPDPTIMPEPALSKSVENLTHPDGPTQVGDRLRYTITASNTAKGSLWSDVLTSDALPLCITLANGTVRLTAADGTTSFLSESPNETPGADSYALSAPDTDGRRTFATLLGDIPGGQSASLSFECIVRNDLNFATANAADLDLVNIAEATGTRPNPDDPDGPPLGPVSPDPSDPVTPPGPGHVIPGDPTAADLAVEKSVENLSRADGTTHVGDHLRYAITVANRGSAATVLWDAIVSDPLPTGIEPVPGTMKLTLPDGSAQPVSDTAYDQTSRTIAIAAGDLWGGQTLTLSFECTLLKEAVGTSLSNIGHLFGTQPSNDSSHDPSDSSDEPGRPAEPPSGEQKASSDPIVPPSLVPDDPQEGQVSITKAVQNLTHANGTTHVGDTVRFEIVLRNEERGTGWIDAVVRDDMPIGLEPISKTLELTLADGRILAVDDTAYDPKARILAVNCGHLYGGQEIRLTFDALVTRDAVGADVGNVAIGYGTLPSQWGPGAPSPEPGTPFDPPGGWKAWEVDRQKAISRSTYVPGANADGGVILDNSANDNGAARGKARSTIAHKLAQTGDAAATTLGAVLALALAASALTLASRRRSRVR